MRKGGDRSSCRGVCPEGRMERGEENGRGPWYATLDSDTGATLLGERYEPR